MLFDLLLIYGALWLVHHFNPCVDVWRPWKKKFISDCQSASIKMTKTVSWEFVVPSKEGFILRPIPSGNISGTLTHQCLMPSSSLSLSYSFCHRNHCHSLCHRHQFIIVAVIMVFNYIWTIPACTYSYNGTQHEGLDFEQTTYKTRVYGVLEVIRLCVCMECLKLL